MPGTPLDDTPPLESESCDRMMGGRATLRQSRRGYRAGLDAALLAAAIEVRAGGRALEAGCGAGGALVQAALRNPGAQFLGLERDPAIAALAVRNLADNGLDGRARALTADVADGFRALGEARFDAAFANPPFFDDETAIRGPAPARRSAWIADDGLAAWIGYLLDAVKDGGCVTLVHRADRLGDILSSLSPRAGSLRVRPVQPFADAPAKRVLVRAYRGGKGQLVILPALVLHAREDGGHTAAADAILRGDAALGWA